MKQMILYQHVENDFYLDCFWKLQELLKRKL